MSSDNPPVCLRCGDFIGAARVALPGLDLCARCFEARAVRPDPIICVPPPRVLALLIGTPLVVTLVLGLVGAIVAFRLGHAPDDGATAGVLASCLLLSLPPVLQRVDRAQDRVWRRATAKTLGVSGTALERLAFVYWKTRPRGLALRATDDVGLLAETPAALAILGARGAREVLPWRRVQTISLRREVHSLWRPLGVRLVADDGSSVWISVRSVESFGANRRLTRELEGRIRERVAAAQSEPAG